jgi:lactoylglutathione lyase
MRLPHSSFELELVAPDEWPYADKLEFGRTHIAFTVDDLCREHVRLAELGVSVDPIMNYTANGAHQTRFFYFNDPEGNQIEFLEPHGRYASKRS